MRLPFTLDNGAASAASFGLIVLQVDETIETELAPVFQRDGLALYHTRIASAAEVTSGNLQEMALALPQAAGLLPKARGLDVVAYACTSGATVIGAQEVARMIKIAHPESKTTDPITAAVATFTHLGVSRPAVITPYIAEVSNAMLDLLKRHGFNIPQFGSFEQSEEAVVARIDPRSLIDAIRQVGAADTVDAVFASCTNLRSVAIIEEAEALIGKPVITSNQALAWHMLTLAGIPTRGLGPGRLFAA